MVLKNLRLTSDGTWLSNAGRFGSTASPEIGHGCQVELAGRNEGRAAPIGAEPAGVGRGEARRERGRVVARQRVAVTLVQVSVRVTQVEGEYALGDADADIPGGVAAIGNAVRIRPGAAWDADLRAIEVVGRAKEPVAGLPGEEEPPALRHSAARRGELRTYRHVYAVGAGAEYGRRVEGSAGQRDVVGGRVGAFCVDLPETQLLLDDIAIDRQIAVRKAVGAEDRGDAAVEALPSRIPVVPTAEIECERTERRAKAAVDVDLRSRAVRERDALARNAEVVLQVVSDVIARLEIGGDRRLVIGLGDATEDVVRGDPGAEGDIPGNRRDRRRCERLDLHVGRQSRRRRRDGGDGREDDLSHLLPFNTTLAASGAPIAIYFS
jgi:hypothetical protein